MDSRVEAMLSFNYVLTIILDNVWTCMAIVTAGAISFIWTSNVKSLLSRYRQASSPSISPQKPDVVHSCSPQLSEPVLNNIVSTPALDYMEGVIKRGKFVIYYHDDREFQEEDQRGNVVCEEMEDDKVPGGVKFCCRDLDMGWYRYLDLSVFSGNVVKLWD